MFCWKCGANNQDGANFCVSCGEKIGTAGTATPAAQAGKNESATSHADKGVELFSGKKYDQAEDEFRKAVELEPENGLYHIYLGMVMSELGKKEGNLETEKGRELGKDDAAVRAFIGSAFMDSEQYDEAINEYREQARITPNDPSPYQEISIALSNMGKNDEALQEIDKAISVDPKNSTSYAMKAEKLVEAGKIEDGMQEFEKAIELKRDDPEIYSRRARVLFLIGRKDDAMKDLDTAIKFGKDNAYYYFQRGIIEDDVESAVADIGTAIKLNPNVPSYYYCRAVRFIVLSRFDEAYHDLKVAVNIKPYDADSWVALALVASTLNKDDRGKGIVQEVLNGGFISKEQFCKAMEGMKGSLGGIMEQEYKYLRNSFCGFHLL
jgi:tetratricopeptide (TPR) repeat protein